MSKVSIAPFGPADVEAVVGLWDVVFDGFALSSTVLDRQTFGCPEFDPEGALVARLSGDLVGFTLATARRSHETGMRSVPGCIEVLMVHPEHRGKGVGSRLLEKAIEYLAARKKRVVKLGHPLYLPGTFFTFLGVNSRWAEAVGFFGSRGFREVDRINALRASLADLAVPDHVREREAALAAEGVTFGPMTDGEERRLLAFLDGKFPGDWHGHISSRMAARLVSAEDVLVVKRRGEIVGFVGPLDVVEGEAVLGGGIGLSREMRGKGAGLVLLFKGMEALKKRGGRTVTVTGVRQGLVENFYGKAGLRESDVWLIMERKLGEPA